VGLLVFGPTGYFVRSWTTGTPAAGAGSPGPATPGPASTASLPPFESNQLALNRTKFDGDLAAFAEPWLAWVGGCATNADPGGPRLEVGERNRVFCRYGGTAVNFVLYKSTAERDDARNYRQRLSLDGHDLAPGLTEPTRKTGQSGVNGSYVEYALRDSNQGRTIAGVWWDREDSPVGLYIEMLWDEGLGGKWEPLRDLWQRHS
jgi:hypothetical protein